MMKPTQEQVIAWAREAGMRVGARRLFTAQDRDLLRLAAIAYEAGRKDEREWQGLTDEEKKAIYEQADIENWHDQPLLEAIEAKLKEKNAPDL